MTGRTGDLGGRGNKPPPAGAPGLSAGFRPAPALFK